LSASIGELGVQVKALSSDITALNTNQVTFEADKKKTEEQRVKDHEAYLAESRDYEESIDALDRAINVLQQQSYDRPASASSALLQLSQNALLPENAKQMITGFLGLMTDDSDASKAPEANAYEFQSGGIIDVLKKLKTEFAEKLAQSQKEEINSKHAADMVIMDLEHSIEAATTDASEKSALKEEKSRDAALYKKQLGEVTADKKSDEDLLSERKTECVEKGFSFKEKQVLRAEEIEALAKAIEILKKADLGSVIFSQGSAKKRGAALVQLYGRGRGGSDSEGVNKKVREFLKAQAQKLHSSNLNLLAEKIAEDPFAKVKTMIKDMIKKLYAEANTDAKKEGFCDTEVGQSKITRAKLTEQVDRLKAEVSEMETTIAMLSEDTSTLSQEIADLVASMAEATELRKKEKSQNAATVEDAKAAAKAVTAALAVLKDFYAKASTATGLVQMDSKAEQPVQMGTDEWDSLANPNFKGVVDKGHKKGMQTFGEVYKGQQEEAGGVLAMIEVILSDLNVLKAETEAAESAAAKEYASFMTESKRAKAQKSKSVELKGSDSTETKSQLQDTIADLKATEDQLLAAERYYSNLEPQCFDKGMTFDERTAARQSEIQSLKEALALLNGDNI